ncbi:Nop52-domain-containing protein [Pseudovirgaria hyperparasitica]|uniref:Nop52-domain-containing protein n=1 Tax=Pseudovirgaria hyperparasitica TaxID=470096 RepID=A0A6A6WJQ9_9PEZI|nr:Nop52-domain-containing protein [Pseudovirgaria hyperparasitica]KAF2761631.1 Nop52-domain-containing protein [Pseudovirgaria hyperparasitica]
MVFAQSRNYFTFRKLREQLSHMDLKAQSSPFVKQLASSDRHARDEALQSLRVYLGSRKGLNDIELLKLWKGLFYCMWMSDKRPVQQRLANDLASLVDILPHETVLPFLSAFWKTMAAQWSEIDRLRMDKFLLLIRRYLHTSFKFLSHDNWKNTSDITAHAEVLQTTPLNIYDSKIPNGLRLHVADIFIDELDRVDEERQGHMPLNTMLEPLKELGTKSPTKPVRERVKEALEDERLQDWNGTGQEKPSSSGAELAVESDEEEWAGIDE